jgi:hypothetical protein
MNPELNCQNIDEQLCDYLDGALGVSERLGFEKHIGGCPACASLVADCRGSLNFLERVAVVEPPKELVTRILYNTPKETPILAVLAGKGLLRRWLQPLLQPRLAMGMAMTILSFSMLGKFVSPVRQLKPADLDPVKVWRSVDDSAHRTWDRFVKYYDNLRLVYEVQTVIEEWKNSPDAAPQEVGQGQGSGTDPEKQKKSGDKR